MADTTPVDVEYDDDGKPIKGELETSKNKDEGGEVDPPENKEDAEEGDEVDPPEPEEEPDIEEKDIPVRKSVQEHIIDRQKRTIEKLRSKEEGDEVDPPDPDDNLEPEARDAINREVDKRLNPVLGALASKVDSDELDTLVKADPDAKKYEKRIKVYMQHPHYKGVPPAVIYHHLAFQDAESIGSKKKKAADLEADQVKGGGTARRAIPKTSTLPTAEELADMTDDEVQKIQDDVLQGKYKEE